MRALPSFDGTVHPCIGLPKRASKFSWPSFLPVVQSDVRITSLDHPKNKTMMDLYSPKIEVFDGWLRGQSERLRSAHGCRHLQSVNKSQRF
jgi:hypothetical protein